MLKIVRILKIVIRSKQSIITTPNFKDFILLQVFPKNESIILEWVFQLIYREKISKFFEKDTNYSI